MKLLRGKPSGKDEVPKEAALVPAVPALSADLELRPPGALPADPGRLLGPRIASYVADAEALLAEMKTIADAAGKAGSPVVRVQVLGKICDVLTKLIALAQASGGSGTQSRPIASQEDLPPWDALSEETQQALSHWIDRADSELAERFGPDWRERRPWRRGG